MKTISPDRTYIDYSQDFGTGKKNHYKALSQWRVEDWCGRGSAPVLRAALPITKHSP
jgi:hypothetical protein